MGPIEAMAKAIYEATDPLSGDPIATVIQISDHLFWDALPGETDIKRQLEAVRIICRVAATAALEALASNITPKMVDSACQATGDDIGPETARRIFRAMIAQAMEAGR